MASKVTIYSIILLHSTSILSSVIASAIIRQNYNVECEALINQHVNAELQVGYTYMGMGFFFNQDDQALHGFSKFFRKRSDEKREHAQKFMEYQNNRGGVNVLQDVKLQEQPSGSILAAVEKALNLEKNVINESLIAIANCASTQKDAHLTQFLGGEFLNGQVKTIKELSDLLKRMNRVGKGLGWDMIDKEMK